MMNDFIKTIDAAIRLIEERKYSAAKELLIPAALQDPSGECTALLGLTYYLGQEYPPAVEHLETAVRVQPGNADLRDLLTRSKQNRSGRIELFVPPIDYFGDRLAALLNRPSNASFSLPNPPAPRFEMWHERFRRWLGTKLGVVASTGVDLITDLWSALVPYRDGIWTNWYRRNLYLGILTLASMRNRLNKHNLKSTYPRGVKVGYPQNNEPPPPSALHFRTADGSWNNLQDPLVGAAGTRFLRNVSKEAIRPETIDDTLLQPNPREVSRKLLTRPGGAAPEMPEVPFLNMLAGVWIQFENHDWINHGEIDYRYGVYEIPLAEDDPARRKYRQKTMFVGRTQADPTAKESEREEIPISFINEVTHWWDGSQIYGSDQATQNRLRSFVDGKLRVTDQGRLPLDGDGLEITGFNRNWWVGLALLHTLFVREHNQICDHLKPAYPEWDDNRLFNVARLINAAIMAKIHTVEWTPAILPNHGLSDALNANWFGILTNLFSYGKDRETLSEVKIANPELGGVVGNPLDDHGVPYGLTEEFVEVYRLHSLLPESLKFQRIGFPQVEDIPVPATRQADAAKLLDQFGVANLLYSFGTQHPGQLVLNNFPRFMQELSIPGNPVFDLGAVDILRARERGVPRYNEFRRQLGLTPIQRFEDLQGTAEQTAALKEVYGDKPEDVEKLDLLIGTLGESSKVRPTLFGFGETMFQIFILNATRRLQADRFFTTSFNEETYTREGLRWIDAADLKTVLLRNYPELRNTGLANVRNAFEPWDNDRLLDPDRHPLRNYEKDLVNDNPMLGERYRDQPGVGWLESIQPGSAEEAAEVERFQSYGRRIQEVQRKVQQQTGAPAPQRAQHVKGTAATTEAVFQVSPTLPEEYRSLLFRAGASYPATVRFSNAHAFAQADTEKDLRGLAVRLALPNGQSCDFLGTNAPYHHAATVEEIIELSEATADPSVLTQALEELEPHHASGALGKITDDLEKIADLSATARRLLVATANPAATFRMLTTLLKQTSVPVESLATETFYSRAPVALAPHGANLAVKYQFTPVTPKSAKPQGAADLQAELRDRLASGPVEFLFQVQLFVDENLTPIEKPTQEWRAKDSPPVTLGRLILRQQDLEKAGAAIDGDALRFNPWNVDPAILRPLGEFNRSRRIVYAASAAIRKP